LGADLHLEKFWKDIDMALKKKGKSPKVEDYLHEDAKRKNIPPAGLAALGRILKIVHWKSA